MSNPEQAATPENQEGVAQQVSEVVKQITTDEAGNFIFPEGVELSPELKFAATAEKRRRDTQQAFTRSQQAIKAQEAANAKLLEQIEAANQIVFTEDEKKELEELKYADPDAWRRKLNSLELEKRTQQKASLEELTGSARKAAELQFELDRRSQVLAEFNETLEKPITDEIIASEIPPRITAKLEKGQVSFEAFLLEVAEYLKTPKAIKNESTLAQPNLGNLGGGSTPSNYKAEDSLHDSYAKTIF